MNDFTFEEKFNWFENLSADEKESVFQHHNQCVRTRTL